MPVEKSFTEFMVMHEKKLMSKDINALESDIMSAADRAISIIGPDISKDISETTKKLIDGITELKKILTKHQLYEIS
jgi:hypothetical protein